VLLAVALAVSVIKLPFGSWLYSLFEILFGVALGYLAFRNVAGRIGRVALVIGGVGWILIAALTINEIQTVNTFFSIVSNLPGGLGTVAEWVALLGTLVAGIRVHSRGLSTSGPRFFLVSTVIAALYLAVSLLPAINVIVIASVVVLFAASLVVTGLVFIRKPADLHATD